MNRNASKLWLLRWLILRAERKTQYWLLSDKFSVAAKWDALLDQHGSPIPKDSPRGNHKQVWRMNAAPKGRLP